MAASDWGSVELDAFTNQQHNEISNDDSNLYYQSTLHNTEATSTEATSTEATSTEAETVEDHESAATSTDIAATNIGDYESADTSTYMSALLNQDTWTHPVMPSAEFELEQQIAFFSDLQNRYNDNTSSSRNSNMQPQGPTAHHLVEPTNNEFSTKLPSREHISGESIGPLANAEMLSLESHPSLSTQAGSSSVGKGINNTNATKIKTKANKTKATKTKFVRSRTGNTSIAGASNAITDSLTNIPLNAISEASAIPAKDSKAKKQQHPFVDSKNACDQRNDREKALAAQIFYENNNMVEVISCNQAGYGLDDTEYEEHVKQSVKNKRKRESLLVATEDAIDTQLTNDSTSGSNKKQRLSLRGGGMDQEHATDAVSEANTFIQHDSDPEINTYTSTDDEAVAVRTQRQNFDISRKKRRTGFISQPEVDSLDGFETVENPNPKPGNMNPSVPRHMERNIKPKIAGLEDEDADVQFLGRGAILQAPEQKIMGRKKKVKRGRVRTIERKLLDIPYHHEKLVGPTFDDVINHQVAMHDATDGRPWLPQEDNQDVSRARMGDAPVDDGYQGLMEDGLDAFLRIRKKGEKKGYLPDERAMIGGDRRVIWYESDEAMHAAEARRYNLVEEDGDDEEDDGVEEGDNGPMLSEDQDLTEYEEMGDNEDAAFAAGVDEQ